MSEHSKWPRGWHKISAGGTFQTLCIDGKNCEITIEARPNYCDRGNYIAKLFPDKVLAMEIDEQDGFPRYYFDLERAKLECEAWLEKRGQKL